MRSVAKKEQFDFWFDAEPLLGARKKSLLGKAMTPLPGATLSRAQVHALAAFAEANGLDFDAFIRPNQRKSPLPGLVLDGDCEARLLFQDTPRIEFGNHGFRFLLHENDLSPTRRGYIAIRHDLEAPHMFLRSHTPGAMTPLAVASPVVNFLGAFDFERSDPAHTSLDVFRERAAILDDLPDAPYRAYVEPGLEDQARTLLVGSAAPHLAELSESFDVENDGGWLFAYSYFGDVSTVDPESWAWAFAAASRMLDVLEAWGADYSSARLPWRTERVVRRPKHLDGALRALAPVMRKLK